MKLTDEGPNIAVAGGDYLRKIRSDMAYVEVYFWIERLIVCKQVSFHLIPKVWIIERNISPTGHLFSCLFMDKYFNLLFT